jgi:vitamin B12 transporter
MNQKLITLALFGAISLPTAACAETTSLDEVVVTATRMPQNLQKTLADTTVLNAAEIRRSGAPDVATLLRSVTGIEVVQSGGLGAQSSTFMRGTNSNQVLVLLDGVRVNSATSGSTALDQLMLDSIERIEIVRGNVSSLYGSEAIGGVIQLFTKQGKGTPALNASAGLGSHGTQRVAAGFAGNVEETSFSLNAGKVKTNGVSALNTTLAPNANPNNNGYDNNTVNAQLKHAFDSEHSVSANWFNSRANGSFDNASGAPTDLNNARSVINKFSLAADEQLTAIWHSQLQWARGSDENLNVLNGVQASRFTTQNNQLTWQNNVSLADTQKLHLAVEHLGQTVNSDTLFSKTTRNVNSLLGGYVAEYDTQQVQLNVRQDRYSDFGNANTGLLGYGVTFADSWRATASLSTAFKAPTFNDLFYPLSFGYQGNPNIKPERSRNQEVGLHYTADGHRVDALYFNNHITDLIASNATGTTVENINQAQITGQELSYAGDFGNKHLQAHMTLQNPRDNLTHTLLKRRAKQFGNVSASHDFADWNMGAELRYSGAREESYFNPTTFATQQIRLPAYTVLNLTTRYQLDTQFNLTARLDNVLNRDYSEAYSYNSLGRTFFIGLNYQQ